MIANVIVVVLALLIVVRFFVKYGLRGQPCNGTHSH